MSPKGRREVGDYVTVDYGLPHRPSLRGQRVRIVRELPADPGKRLYLVSTQFGGLAEIFGHELIDEGKGRYE